MMESHMTDRVQQLSTRFGFDFTQDVALSLEALTQVKSTNKRLAILGDNVANTSLILKWYATTESAGSLSSRIQTYLSNQNLGRRGQELNIEELMLCEHGATQISPGMISTAMEAIIGAGYCIGGQAAVDVILDRMDLGPRP